MLPMRRAMFVALVLGATTVGCPDKQDTAGPDLSTPKPPGARGYHAVPVLNGRTIEVRVNYTGTGTATGRPAPSSGWTIPAMVRSQCGGADRTANDALSVSPDGGVDDAVVWLDDIHEGAALQALSARAYEQDETRCAFSPHVLALPVAGTLKLINSDPANHAVHFEHFERGGDRADESEDFTKTLPPGTSLTIPVKLDWAEQWFRVTCPIHLWMSAYVHVFNHPYFSVTRGGVARLENVPPGRYHVSVWHEGIGVTFTSSLKFPPPETARGEVDVERADGKVAFDMSPDGKLAAR
jgi:hypothetical protein